MKDAWKKSPITFESCANVKSWKNKEGYAVASETISFANLEYRTDYFLGPGEVVHIIYAHSHEGDKTERSPESYIVHHCDFIDFHIRKSMVNR